MSSQSRSALGPVRSQSGAELDQVFGYQHGQQSRLASSHVVYSTVSAVHLDFWAWSIPGSSTKKMLVRAASSGQFSFASTSVTPPDGVAALLVVERVDDELGCVGVAVPAGVDAGADLPQQGRLNQPKHLVRSPLSATRNMSQIRRDTGSQTLFRNHRGGRRPLVECPTAYP
jgi:hypothetical protein